MSYFLSDKSLKAGDIAELSGEEARHILLSRRVKVGEIIEIQGPDNKRFKAEVTMIDRKSLQLQVLEEIAVPDESPLRITIFQALIKEQPLDYIIQKTTELGADRLMLFYSKNSVERFKDIEKKLSRWRKIAEEAAKQSDRVKPIDIEYIKNSEINPVALEQDRVFLLEPGTDENLAEIYEKDRVAEKIGILIGPEGGFTEEEIRTFTKIRNIVPIGLGPRIVRADTAAISSTAIIQALWGDI